MSPPNLRKIRKNSLTLPTCLNDCFKNITSTVVRTSSACSSFFQTHGEDPSLIYAAQKRNFKFQATGSPHLAGVFPFSEIKERMKKSVQLIHPPTGHGRSRQNKSMRDEELISRKAEHLTIVK